MSNVISLNARRNTSQDYYAYQYERMNTLELLEIMVKFQEERSRLGRLTPDMITRGIPLFKRLSLVAETEELRTLTASYWRHLECEKKERA